MVVGDVMEGVADASLNGEELLSMGIIVDGWELSCGSNMFLEMDWLRHVVDSESGEADKVWPTGGPMSRH